MKELLETWQIHNKINLCLLEAIANEHLSDRSASKGRTVGEQWAHIHNVRLMWLQSALPEHIPTVEKIEKENIQKKQLSAQLTKSGAAILKMLEKALLENKLKGFKPHPTAFLGYLIAHESHHRGQIIMALKQAGHPIDKKTAFGIWEWGTK